MIYSKKRDEMIINLRKLGINSDLVLNAMNQVPRHKFVALGSEFQAYDEKALPIGFDQTISHPYTVAVMSQALNLKKGERILEIGTGSGYQAAVLCQMGAQVFTIERISPLGKNAESILKELKYHFAIRIGDGTMGWQTYAPYDGIIVTAGAPVSPESLLSQLKEGGKLLIPVGDKDEQMLTMYIRQGSKYSKIEIEKLSFVPLIGQYGWQK
ncbi:MAG: protein-L-isoaspartate(D-aspartate) O-methyltransferase [Calditrichaeota bacterium]|nr:MAG: protein-L-isoaspartate(D-aspartate) O-methyltransferase [Calditrichota bacterium]MBL1204169.1 protein-L-isoaspartate(D-aspartate) O-methyltransferase [Calditrichota bacterium]NOG43999.1 protein-L-isoaspartate(D-aspartate) O-methyltransferase [Calditrichota bacterium]